MNGISQFFNTQTRKYALAGVVFGFLFPVVGTMIRIAVMRLPFTLSSIVAAQASDPLLWIIDTAPFFLGLFAALAGLRQDRSEQLNIQLRQREKELEIAQTSLEERVQDRTHELTAAIERATKQAGQMRLIADVARSAISIQNVEELLPYVAQLISHRFDFYHVGVFLLDEQAQYAVLRATNSEGGQKMLERGHRLKVGGQGIVGFVAAQRQARVALDVGKEAVYFNNPELPDTHSEVALPLLFGQEIIGALDIQSTEVNAFSQADVEILSILADLVSGAIQNAFSYERTQRALREVEIASKRSASEAWKGYAETIRTPGYRYDGVKAEALKEVEKPEGDVDALTVPVQLRGQTIGRLKLKPSDPARGWTEDELAMIEATAERVALALDGARLLNDAQRRAAREAFLSDMTTRLGTSFQLDSILRDTVEELGQALKGSTVSFQLVNPSSPPTGSPRANGGSATGNKIE